MKLIQDEQVVVDATRAWWTSVLSSSGDGPGPGVATIPFPVPSDTDPQISSQPDEPEGSWPHPVEDAADLNGNGSLTELASPGAPSAAADHAARQLQTVIGTFESESRAQIAANYLASIQQIRSSALWVLAPKMGSRDEDDEPSDAPDVYWDDPYWEPVQSALGSNRAVLIWIVDEAGSNQARAILDEDTGSLHTAVLPRPPRFVPAPPPLPQTLGILSALPVLE